MAETQIIVPWPATLNEYYRAMVATKGGRIMYGRNGKPICRNVLSKKARDYRKSIAATILDKLGKLSGPIYENEIGVAVYYFPPDKRGRDVDNYFKGLFDGFTHGKIWIDDKIIKQLTVDWCETVTPKKYPDMNMRGCVVVRIWPIPFYEPMTLDDVLGYQFQPKLLDE